MITEIEKLSLISFPYFLLKFLELHARLLSLSFSFHFTYEMMSFILSTFTHN